MSIMRSNIARQLYNTGGITNLINTYQNNPTLQNQMTQQEYVDLFNSQPTSTNTTEQIIQSSTAPTIEAPTVRPLLPIIPQQGGDGGGGITSIDREGLRSADDYGLGVDNQTGMGYQLTEEDLKNIDSARFKSGLNSFLYDIKQFSPTMQFIDKAKTLKDKGQQAIKDFFEAREAAKAAEVARIARQNLAASMGSDAGPGEGAGTFGASVNEATGARGSGTGFSDYT